MKLTQKSVLFAVALLMATSHVLAMQSATTVDKTKEERKYGCGSWSAMLTRPRNVMIAGTAALAGWLGYSKANREKAVTFVNENRTNLIYGGIASAFAYMGYRWYSNRSQAALEPAVDTHVGASHDGCNHDHTGAAGRNQPKNGVKEQQAPEWALRLQALILKLSEGKKAEIQRYFGYLQTAFKSGPYELLGNQQFMTELSKEQKQDFLAILRAFRMAYTVQVLQQLVGPQDEWLKAYLKQNLQTLLENPDYLKSQEAVMKKLTPVQVEHYQANLEILHYYMGEEAAFMVNNDLK